MSKATRPNKSTANVGGASRADASVDGLKRTFLEHLLYTQGRFIQGASLRDGYMALAYTVRDQLLHRWVRTLEKYMEHGIKLVSYLSAEFLLGPHLENNLINLGLYQEARKAVEDAGFDFQRLVHQEEEPGLGNGGLGRLAACYLDSLATCEIQAIGYGIRYEFGIFDQLIRDGWQVEQTDQWLRWGNPWEIPRPEFTHMVNFGGYTEAYQDEQGRHRVRWVPHRTVKGVAYDTPIVGYRVNTCNLLRLWKAEAVESFEFAAFNVGDYYGAVNQKISSENITKVLYPNDEPLQGKQLRLEQQYFFVSCSLQDMARLFKAAGKLPEGLRLQLAIQLNDTHPAIAVAELMGLLVDEEAIGWEAAWEATRKTFDYTKMWRAWASFHPTGRSWNTAGTSGRQPRSLSIWGDQPGIRERRITHESRSCRVRICRQHRGVPTGIEGTGERTGA